MTVRSILPPVLLAWALLLATRPVSADDFPKELVAWTPIVGNPVFQGTGGDSWDKKIRERGYILVENGTYHLWYTGYLVDRRRPLVARPGQPDLHGILDRGYVRAQARRHVSHGRRG